MKYIHRNKESDLLRSMENYPVSAIIGARQTGKSTLSKFLMEKTEKQVYLDLENPQDLAKLQNPKDYFELHIDKIICIDEIQRKKELFPVIRSLVDQNEKNGYASHEIGHRNYPKRY
jgi:predicted AAA+ superfamily ATPase